MIRDTAHWRVWGALVSGLLLLGIQQFWPDLPWEVSLVLFVIGTGFLAVSSAQLGAAYLGSRDAKQAQALLRAPFRRTVRLYRLFETTEAALAGSTRTLRRLAQADGRVSVDEARAELERLSMLLETREDYEDALAEWEESLPQEARELFARMAEED